MMGEILYEIPLIGVVFIVCKANVVSRTFVLYRLYPAVQAHNAFLTKFYNTSFWLLFSQPRHVKMLDFNSRLHSLLKSTGSYEF